MDNYLNGLIDNHYHFRGDENLLKQEIKKAFENDLFAIIEAGTSLNDFTKRLNLVDSFEKLYFTTGIHPDNFNESPWNEAQFKEQIKHPKNIAIGEIGLDYTSDISKINQQKLLSYQLEIAKEMNIPVMLHLRDAFDDALAILKEHQISNGVVHCFTGNVSVAKAFLDNNFYLSFSGILTFKNAVDIQTSAIYAPINKVLLETDAPYLAPVPHRGKENKLSYIFFIYDYMAKLKGIANQDLIKQIQDNFIKFYFNRS